MAAIQKAQSPITCSGLLQKLKRGQQDLKKSFKNLTDSKQESEEGQRRAVRRRRQLLERPLNTVQDLPRKRARLELLSPGIESKGTRKHPRRFSSTPKKCDKPLTHSAPAVDLSLEEALLKPSKPHPACDHQPSSIDDSGAQFLPSPKLSRVVVNTSRSVQDSPVEKYRHSHGLCKKASRSKNGSSKRGLSVSFVGDKDHDHTQRQFSTSQRSNGRTPHSKEKEMGKSLIQSLNESRHGALDRKLSQRRSLQRFPRKYFGDDPQLGYDWIAGLIDASDSYLNERDDDYFKEMKEFRRVNCSECSKPREAMLPDSLVRTDSVDVSSEGQDGDEGYCGNTSTTCVKSYSLNDRLFPIPQHMNFDPQAESGRGILEECCPVCEDKHTTSRSPVGYVRVSVPRRTLQGSLRLKPHRRRSFDPTDSMGLSKHCLVGWETAQPSIIPPQASVGLKSAVEGGADYKKESRVRSCDLLNTSHCFEYNLRSRSAKRT